MWRRGLLVVAAVVVAGCGEDAPATGNTVEVTQAEYGEEWPLTVDQGTLACEPPQGVTFAAPDGSVYAVNGAAQDYGHSKIDPIWRVAPEQYDPDFTLRVSIGPLISRGLELCKE